MKAGCGYSLLKQEIASLEQNLLQNNIMQFLERGKKYFK